MLEANPLASNDVSIVPPAFNDETGLAARELAAACFSENEKMLRLLVISNEESSNNKTGARIVPRADRRDFTESETYKHPLSGSEFKINNKEGQGAYIGILNSAADQMYICFQKFGRRLVAIRIDLHMKDPEPDNKMVSKLLKNLNRKIKRRFSRHKQLGYIWVAETGSQSNKKHYHLHLYLNGNCVRTSMYILPMLKATWAALKDGNTVAPASYYKYITKADQLKTAVYDMSYLAKSKDKGFQLRNVNDYCASRIKIAA